MKNYVQDGVSIKMTATADVKSGDLVVKGALIGFAQTDADTGEEFAAVTEGVYLTDVASATDIDVGDIVYVDGSGLTSSKDDGDGGNYMRAGIVTTGGVSDGTSAACHVKINA